MATISENNGDASASTETTYTISLGDVFKGEINSAGDQDWLKVELTAGTIYDFTLSGIESAELSLFNSSGNPVIYGGAIASGAKLIFSPDATGTYYIQVGSYDDVASVDYDISLVENTIPVGSYEEIAGYLTDGYWEGQGSTRSAFDVESGGVLAANITALTEEGQQLARWALEAWTNVTGITFEFVDHDNAHLMFDDDDSDPDSVGYAYSIVSDGVIESSVVNVSTNTLIRSGTAIDSASFTAYVHEIGHALGLGHPGPYDGSGVVYYETGSIFLNDSYQATVMSYWDQKVNTYIDASLARPVTPMIADIIAIQNLYGAPDSINTGDTVYGYQSNLDGYLGEFFRLWTGEANPFINIDMTDDTTTPAIKPRLADLDGDGDPDLVVGNNTGLLYYFENTGTSATPGFMERTGTNNPLSSVSVGSYSTPAFADLDGDGDHDLVVGNEFGAIACFENTGTVTSPDFSPRTGTANPFDDITMGSWSTLALADLDGDGDPDLAVGTDDGDVRYYENIGTSTNPGFTLRTGEASPLNNVNAGSNSTPVFVDFDDDNDFDLVVGNSDGNIFYFENTGTTANPGFTQRAGFDNPFLGANAGFLVAPEFVDLNGDGKPDLITGNETGVITWFKNTGTHANPGFSPASLTIPAALTIYDNGGNDTLDLRTDTKDQRVYLRPEGISDVYGLTGNLVIARDTLIENYIAGSGNDVIAGNAVANHINGRDGNDRIWGSGGNDILEGGAGADRLDGGPGTDWLSYAGSDGPVSVRLYDGYAARGHAEGDTISDFENLRGSDYSDFLAGSGGANRLEGGGGDDRLRGVGGDDVLEGGAGADRLDGGPGTDWLSYAGSDGPVSVRLYDGYAARGHAEGDTISDFENLRGSDYSDFLAGSGGANRLEGGGGDDRLGGGSGDDVLEGGAGADRLDGGPGTDWLSYAGSDGPVSVRLYDGYAARGHAEGDTISGFENLRGSDYPDFLAGSGGANRLEGGGGDDRLGGGSGDDVLEGGAGADQLYGGAGADRLDGSAGIDWIFYWRSDAGVKVNLEDGTGEGGEAEGDAIADVENVMGSHYGDVLIGDGGENILQGLDGNDQLQGKGGNDWLHGGAGADRLDGGDGLDWVTYQHSDAGVTVDLRDGTGEGGNAQGDTIVNVENIDGSDHRDVLIGDNDANNLQGRDGDDEIRGNGGDDWLYGNAGADRLEGGGGTDRHYGDEGSDIFIFDAGHGDDIIYDFTNEDDQIDLSAFSLSGFDELTISTLSDGVKIDLTEQGGGTILLQNFDIADLDAADFLF